MRGFNLEKSIRTGGNFMIITYHVSKNVLHLFYGAVRRDEHFMMINTLSDMIMGMIASPLMMKGIKIIRQRRKVDRILREISHEQRNYGSEVKSGNTQGLS